MDSSEDRWAEFHKQALPYEQAIREEPFATLIETILEFVGRHNIQHTLETGFGTGYIMIKLASKGLNVMGFETSESLVNRLYDLADKQNANILVNRFDLFDPASYENRFLFPHLFYHQGLLEHFPNARIRELLELQTKNSFAVIFSVPSFFYGRQDFGDERLLAIEQWQEILIPFDLIKLEYYDDKKHIVGILKGDFYDKSE